MDAALKPHVQVAGLDRAPSDRPGAGRDAAVTWALIAGIGLCGTAAFADAPRMPTVGCWGYNGYYQCNPPAGLGAVVQISAGAFHTAVVDANGIVSAWGDNLDGQCDVVLATEAAREVRCGNFFTAVLTIDGLVSCFGNDDWGQLGVPEGLQGVTQIATGDAHVLARRGDGTVAMWGMDIFGQSTPPAGLAGVSRVAAGAYHSLALRSDGVITGWGLNANGQCTAPADLGAVSDLSGGLYHTLALRSDGKVRAWGLNSTQQCEVPITLSRVVQVAAGDYHSAALTDLGEVAVWGTSPAGDLHMPSRIAGVSSIASGTYHLGAIFEGDCNANGVLDATDVAQGTVHDHNVNGQPDECDLARGYEEDCDHDGVIDSYEQGLYAYAYASSGPVGPIGDGHPVQWTYENPSLTLDDPVLAVHIRGDFSSPSEWLQVTMNGRYIARLLASGADKNDCRDTMTRYVSIPRDFFNQYIQAGDDVTSALFEATTSLAVNADQCPSGSFVWFEVAYTAATTGDCNANGLLDTCEIGAHPETDLNSDGVLDACQGARLVTLCPGDIDMDGSISLADLSLMLLNFGPCMPGDPADLDGSLNVDNSDINLMLLDFGPCS